MLQSAFSCPSLAGDQLYPLFCAISSTCEISLTSVGEAMGWFKRMRQCRIDDSSRRTTGRPVPRLILRGTVSFGSRNQDLVLLTDDQTNKDRAISVQTQLQGPVGENVRWQATRDIPRLRSSSSVRFLPPSSASFSSARWRPRSNAIRIACPLGSHPFVLQAASSSMPTRQGLSESIPIPS